MDGKYALGKRKTNEMVNFCKGLCFNILFHIGSFLIVWNFSILDRDPNTKKEPSYIQDYGFKNPKNPNKNTCNLYVFL